MLNAASKNPSHKSLYKIQKSKEGFNISPACKHDMTTAAKIISSTAEWYRPIIHEDDLSEHTPDSSWIERNWKIRDFFICRDGERAVGILSMQEIAEMSYLGYIYVHKAEVGKGYGKKMLEFAELRSRALGHKAMFLISHPKAKWAIKAYEKYGFKKFFDNERDILEWNDGCMEPYYEKGFHFFVKEHSR